MDIAESIKIYRKKKRFTQRQLAEKVGVATVTIQNYELKKREPNIEMLNKISNALDTSIGELLLNVNAADVVNHDNMLDVIAYRELSKYSFVLDFLESQSVMDLTGFSKEDFSKEDLVHICYFTLDMISVKIKSLKYEKIKSNEEGDE